MRALFRQSSIFAACAAHGLARASTRACARHSWARAADMADTNALYDLRSWARLIAAARLPFHAAALWLRWAWAMTGNARRRRHEPSQLGPALMNSLMRARRASLFGAASAASRARRRCASDARDGFRPPLAIRGILPFREAFSFHE